MAPGRATGAFRSPGRRRRTRRVSFGLPARPNASANRYKPLLKPTLKLPNFTRRKSNIEARLNLVYVEITTNIKGEFAGTVWPKRLRRLKFTKATDVG